METNVARLEPLVARIEAQLNARIDKSHAH